jgi:hypothetical protein
MLSCEMRWGGGGNDDINAILLLGYLFVVLSKNYTDKKQIKFSSYMYKEIQIGAVVHKVIK